MFFRRKLLILSAIIIFMIAIAISMITYEATRRQRAEYASCECTLTAMVPKLRAYAATHNGQLPDSETELTIALGGPLPPRYAFIADECALQPIGAPMRSRYIIDIKPHPYYFSWLGLFPRDRIHMLLTDMTVYHSGDYKAFT